MATGASDVDDAESVYLLPSHMQLSLFEREVSATKREPLLRAAVRAFLVAEQRRLAEAEVSVGRGVVMEGRDIGTVVFPDAGLKVFLTADPGVRARRRAAELADRGHLVDEEDLRADLVARDRYDSGRDVSPLREAVDAVRVDTSLLDFHEQVARIVALARERTA